MGARPYRASRSVAATTQRQPPGIAATTTPPPRHNGHTRPGCQPLPPHPHNHPHNHPQLRQLSFEGAALSIEVLTSLPKLRTLSLRSAAVTDDDVRELAACRSLEDLDLRGTAVTDVSALCALTSLRRLRVGKLVSAASAMQMSEGCELIWNGAEFPRGGRNSAS